MIPNPKNFTHYSSVRVSVIENERKTLCDVCTRGY